MTEMGSASSSTDASMLTHATSLPSVKRRKLNLKANFEGGPLYYWYSFKRLVTGAFARVSSVHLKRPTSAVTGTSSP
jgi:hypothetical protein